MEEMCGIIGRDGRVGCEVLMVSGQVRRAVCVVGISENRQAPK